MAPPTPTRNFRTADWEVIRNHLSNNVTTAKEDGRLMDALNTYADFDRQVVTINMLIKSAIEENIPETTQRPTTRRWWTTELTLLKCEGNKLSRRSWSFRALPNHESHKAYSTHQNLFDIKVKEAKQQHWEDFLETATEREMWIANGYIKSPVGDAGRPRIPSLQTKDQNGATHTHDTNEAKAFVIAESLFPLKLDTLNIPVNYPYPQPLNPATPISPERVKEHIKALSPYKAPEPDGIPNIALQQTTDIVTPIFAQIFTAALENGWYHPQWKESIMCVLKKPGKSNYQDPKAYRPIALLSTTAKLLSAIVAEDMTWLIEKHHLLPANHFGGRPGRTTTDALHYLVNKVKKAWKHGKVVTILFLDVEGAFPNAVPEQVVHNLKKRQIPEPYVVLIKNMLTDRRTCLRFDDYLSQPWTINNGIGQGCPLSMIIYIIYNADLLKIPNGPKEDAIGYVDDASMMAVGNSFSENNNTITLMMEHANGGLQWSHDHNSRFAVPKLAVMHMSTKTITDNNGNRSKLRESAPDLIIGGQIVKKVQEYKYLGIIVNAELKWKSQTMRAVEKATKWVMMYKRLTKPITGMRLRLVHHLWLSVGIPKLTYALDVWYTPPHKQLGKTRNTGSVMATKLMTRVQRTASLAITGAFKSTATDIADAHAGLPPMQVTLKYICHRAMARHCTLPKSHPNHDVINRPIGKSLKSSDPPLTRLAHLFQLKPNTVEKIFPVFEQADTLSAFSTSIPATREESIHTEQQDPAEITIYTDGSGFEGGVGAAAVMYRSGKTSPEKILHYHLGSSDQHSTFEAELVGLLLAAWLLMSLGIQWVCSNPISIYTDCQGAIRAATHPGQGPGQHLIDSY